MHTAIHDLLTERAELRSRVHELTVQLEVARQMTRATTPVGRVS